MDKILLRILEEKQEKIEKLKETYSSLIATYSEAKKENDIKIAKLKAQLDENEDNAKKLNELIAAKNSDPSTVLDSFPNINQKKIAFQEEVEREIAILAGLSEEASNKIRDITALIAQIDESTKGLQNHLEESLGSFEKDMQEMLATLTILDQLSNNFDKQIAAIENKVLSLDPYLAESEAKGVNLPEEEKNEKTDRGNETLAFDTDKYLESAATFTPEAQLKQAEVEKNLSADDKIEKDEEAKGSDVPSNIIDLGSMFKIDQDSSKKLDELSSEATPDIIPEHTPELEPEEAMTDFDLADFDQFNDTPEKNIAKSSADAYLGLADMDFSNELQSFIINIMPAERFGQVANVLNNYGIDLHDLNGVEPFVDRLVTADPSVLDQNLNLLRSVGKNNEEQDLLLNLNYILSVRPEQISQNIKMLQSENVDFKTVSILRICFGEKYLKTLEKLGSQGFEVSGIGKEYPITSTALSPEEFLNFMAQSALERAQRDDAQHVNQMRMGG